MRIGNLNEMPWYLRLAIFGGIALVVYGAFWYFITSGMHQEVDQLKDQVATLKQQTASAQIDSQRLVNFKAMYESKQQEMDDLKALLPEQRELTNVLQGVQDRAHSASLVLKSFTPKDDVSQGFYSGKKISIGVTSSFSSLREFFELMARYQRIVSISNFEITQLDKQSKGKTVDAKFELTAYYVSSDSLQKGTPQTAQGAPVAPGTQGAPNAPPTIPATTQQVSAPAPPNIKIPQRPLN